MPVSCFALAMVGASFCAGVRTLNLQQSLHLHGSAHVHARMCEGNAASVSMVRGFWFAVYK